MLRGSIGGEPDIRPQRHHRSGINDARPSLLRRPQLQLRDCFPTDPEDCLGVDGKHMIPGFIARRFRKAVGHHARIIKEEIDTAECIECGANNPLRCAGLRTRHFGKARAQLMSGQVDSDDLCAPGMKKTRARAPDAGRRARYDGHLARQILRHSSHVPATLTSPSAGIATPTI